MCDPIRRTAGILIDYIDDKQAFPFILLFKIVKFHKIAYLLSQFQFLFSLRLNFCREDTSRFSIPFYQNIPRRSWIS